MPTTTTNDLARIARQPEVDLFDYVVAVGEDGAPVLGAFAPDVCENDPLPALNDQDRVALRDSFGNFMALSSAGYAAREVARGRLVRVAERQFAMVRS